MCAERWGTLSREQAASESAISLAHVRWVCSRLCHNLGGILRRGDEGLFSSMVLPDRGESWSGTAEIGSKIV